MWNDCKQRFDTRPFLRQNIFFKFDNNWLEVNGFLLPHSQRLDQYYALNMVQRILDHNYNISFKIILYIIVWKDVNKFIWSVFKFRKQCIREKFSSIWSVAFRVLFIQWNFYENEKQIKTKTHLHFPEKQFC